MCLSGIKCYFLALLFCYIFSIFSQSFYARFDRLLIASLSLRCRLKTFYKILQNYRSSFGINIAFFVFFLAFFKARFCFYGGKRFVLKTHSGLGQFLGQYSGEISYIKRLCRLVTFITARQSKYKQICTI